jgi:hypothetical protein
VAGVGAEALARRFDEEAAARAVGGDAPHGGDRADDALLGQEALERGLAPTGEAFPKAQNGGDVVGMPGGVAAAVRAAGAALEAGQVVWGAASTPAGEGRTGNAEPPTGDGDGMGARVLEDLELDAGFTAERDGGSGTGRSGQGMVDDVDTGASGLGESGARRSGILDDERGAP